VVQVVHLILRGALLALIQYFLLSPQQVVAVAVRGKLRQVQH
jgi:hypothetical protein